MITSYSSRLNGLSKTKKDLFFIQIGANDGITDDPIHKMIKRYKWSGVLIEPVLEYFKRLKLVYKDVSGLKFVNAAISQKNGFSLLYGVSDQAPFWIRLNTRTKNSFSKETILSHSWYMPSLEKYIVGQKVKSISFETLIKLYTKGKVDMLFVDTEGYDFEILKQVNFKKIRPTIVYYEHKHLSKSDKNKSWKMLKEHGYFIERGLWNTFAYLR